MPKAIISNRILLDVNQEEADIIKKTLTYKFPVYKGSGNHMGFEVLRTYSTIKPGIMSIPQGRIDLIPKGHEIIDKRIIEFADFPDAKIPMRNKQTWVYEQVEDSCFINAKVGWGKTFSSLHIAKKLGQKTLVIVTTLELLRQWTEEIEKLFGFKPGVITSGKFNIDSPVVVGNIQSVNKRIAEINDKFGTVILDEAHHVSANTFTTTINSMKARYRIALSGTTKRKDGKHVMFQDFFSPRIWIPELLDETLEPYVQVLKTGITLVGGTWAEKVNNLMYDNEYVKFICNLVNFYTEKGHCVLLPGERVEFLQRCKTILGEDYVLVTGETKDRKELLEQISNGTKKGLLGSRMIFSEGFSEDKLSCIILSSPINNDILLEQLIGRIQRKYEGKLQPVVVDLHFSGRTGKTQNSNRMGFYLEKNWEIRGLV